MQDDPENDPDGEAVQRPTSFLEFWFLRKREQESSGRWECGNPAWLAGFPRDGGKRGKPGFGFPRFPRARHFPRPLSGAVTGSVVAEAAIRSCRRTSVWLWPRSSCWQTRYRSWSLRAGL